MHIAAAGVVSGNDVALEAPRRKRDDPLRVLSVELYLQNIRAAITREAHRRSRNLSVCRRQDEVLFSATVASDDKRDARDGLKVFWRHSALVSIVGRHGRRAMLTRTDAKISFSPSVRRRWRCGL